MAKFTTKTSDEIVHYTNAKTKSKFMEASHDLSK